jgi:iron complex transport system permease protein
MSHIKEQWSKRDDLSREYLRFQKRKALLLSVLTIICLSLAVIASGVGAYDLSISEVLKSLLGFGAKTSDLVVWNMRLPRIAAAIASGASLSLSGLIIQTLLQNPLASPSTLGISHGAAFGASFAIVFLGVGNLSGATLEEGVFSSPLMRWYGITGCALVGGLSVIAVIGLLQRMRRLSASIVILAGVALSSLFISGTVFVQYFADEVEISAAVFWTFGDVSRSTWGEITVISVITLAALVYFVFRAQTLNAIKSGDEVATTLGVHVKRFRFWGLVVACALGAVTTSFHGVIAFLGLLAPHISRRLIGQNHLYLVPCSVLVGAILLVASDTLGKVTIGAGTFPVGVITSFLGAPLFLYLLVTGKNHDRR